MNKSRCILSVPVLLGLVFIFSGCGNKGMRREAVYSMDMAATGGVGAEEMRAGFADSAKVYDGGSGNTPVNPQAGASVRKLVSRASLRVRIQDPEEGAARLEGLLDKFDAWSASANIYENGRNYSIRVPARSYNAMLEELKTLGKILFLSETTEDVTLHYYDLESRLTTQRELLRTFQGYLGKAKSIEEIMAVEQRIAELQGEIDRTGTQFRFLADLVDYASIDLEISGPENAGIFGRRSLAERIGELFGGFGDNITEIAVIALGAIIYGIPVLLIALILYWILLGRIGLLRKLWRLASGKKKAEQKPVAVNQDDKS
jgi:hypothetical protein